MKKNTKKSKGSAYQKVSIIMIAIALIMFGSLIFMYTQNESKFNSDYAQIDVDKNVVPIYDDDEKKMSSSDGGGSVSLKYSSSVYIFKKNGKVELFFQNPSKSNQNAILEVSILDDTDEEEKKVVIAKSDLIPSGYAVYNLHLLDNIELSKNEYNGNFIISYYDENTGEKAMVNTDIPIVVKVE